MDTTTPKKPKWLRRLERESWQAELIISGAAIFGSLQLPGLLDQLQHYLLLNFERSSLILWFFATNYWGLFVYILILLFVYHFVLRALWIGLAGLNSVYPEGYVGNAMTSQDYRDKVRAEYGDIDGFIARLDRSASSIFGIGFTFAGLFFNIGLIASLSVLAVTWLQGRGLSQFLSWLIGLAPVLLILGISMLSSLLSLPQLRDKDWVKRVHFPLTKVLSSLLYPINSRFTVTGLMLMSGNKEVAEKKSIWHILWGFVKAMFVFFLIGIISANSGVMKRAFIDEVYHRMGDYPATTDSKNYAETPPDGLLYEPILSARYPGSSDPLWVWVPLPERELRPLLDNCSVAPLPADLERREERKAERVRTIACAQQYIELYLDDQPLSVPMPLWEYRSSAGYNQFGVRLELTEYMPAPGNHTLRVITHYPFEEGTEGDWRRTYIPFTVVGQ